MAAPTAPQASVNASEPVVVSKNDTTECALDPTKQERLVANQEMVRKYQGMFPKIPTMTSEELVERWRQIDKLENDRDDSQSDDSYDENALNISKDDPGPLLLIDVRSKAEQAVSMIPGAVAMEDPETTRWINKYVHHFDGEHKGGMPTIVTYCTVGYRSGREAQHLVDDLTGSFGIEIGKSVEIKNLDGILAYSFVENAPPLLSGPHKGSSENLMTRRIHSYGKEWSEAADPSFEVVYFDSKPQKAKHLLQTGIFSAMRMVQHQFHKSTNAAVNTTNSMAMTVVEPVAKMAGTSVMGTDTNSRAPSKHISATGYTSNQSTGKPSQEPANIS